MSVSPKEVIRRLYKEAWNERKFDLIDQLVSQSHGLVAPNVSGAAVGPTAYKRQIVSLVAGFPDLRFVVEEIISENEKIVAAWTFTGTHRGEFLGIAPTNKRVSVAGITIHQIASGKILDSHAAWDALGLLRQLGVELPHKLERRAVSTTWAWPKDQVPKPVVLCATKLTRSVAGEVVFPHYGERDFSVICGFYRKNPIPIALKENIPYD
jgi:steroid delta-isomerase-like uncharacterized protein